MKRVLFLIGNAPLSLPATMMQFLRREQFYVHLLYYDRGNSSGKIPLPALVDSIETTAVRWPVGKSRVIKFINRLILIILLVRQTLKIKPDVIHAWNVDMLFAAWIARLFARHSRIVFNLQDTSNWMLSPIIQPLLRRLFYSVDAIFVTSHGFETGFLRKFHLIDLNKEIVFIPNVPPSKQFSGFKSREPDMTLTLGYIGNLRGVLGIKMLVQAAFNARKKGAQIRILFAGTGSASDIVRDLSKTHDFVDYVGPYRHDEGVLDLYRQVDVFYALYDYSYDKQIHFAYRLSDAVHCCLPIIVAEGTHMAEIVNRLDIGLSIRLGDVDGLTNILVDLANSPETRQRFARNCAAVYSEFVFERYEAAIRTAYQNL